MVLIQVDLDEEENKIVSFYRIEKDLVDKRDAIKKIIREFNKKRR